MKLPLHDALHALTFLKSNAPYIVRGRFPHYQIMYEDGPIAHYDWTPKDYVEDICHKMNAAYMEGYLQRNREVS